MARAKTTKPVACPVEAYARDVVAGRVVAGRPVRLACERHLRDLKAGPARGLRWDGAAVGRVVKFFSYLRLPQEGELDGKAFALEAFQVFIIGSLFGWKGADGNRRFRTAYIEIGKGNGKSPLAAGVGLIGLLADGEASAEIYSAATKLEQAKILFRDAKQMVEASPALRSRVKIDIANLAYLPTGSFFRPVSSEKRGLDGPRPHMGLIDELHEHPDDVVVGKIRAGTKNRRQALIFEITNSGCDRTSVCRRHHDFSADVLEGRVENDSWFAYVCQLDPCEACRAEGLTTPKADCEACDDWHDERVWPKANPGLGTILPAKYLREQVAEADGMPANENRVKRLNFCVWTEAVTHAIPMDKWDACAGPVGMEALKGRECFGGLDIGATQDFTAYTLLFPHDDADQVEVPVRADQPEGDKIQIVRRSYTLAAWFWLPERPRRRDPALQQVIDGWKRAGLVKTTPGDVVDYDQVLQDVVDLSALYPTKKIAYDKGFQGSWMGMSLLNHFGAEAVFAFQQGIISMNPPFRELVELVIQGRLRHDGNQVLRWMAGNTAAETRGGLVKPSKDHSKEKIDGITAATMALGVAMTSPASCSGGMEVW